MFGDMMMEVLFIDFAVPVTVELAGLREIPPPFLKDFGFIPPQVITFMLLCESYKSLAAQLVYIMTTLGERGRTLVCSPQAVKCRLAEVDAPGVDWSPEAIVWLREKVLEAESCKVKVTC